MIVRWKSAPVFTMRVIAVVALIAGVFTMANCRNSPENTMNANMRASAGGGPQPNPYYSRTDTTTLHVSDEEWKRILPDEVYQIARNKDTERPFTGKYWDATGVGTYYCAVCGNPLFLSDAKFASTCGWPSFFETIRPRSVIYRNDDSYGMQRIEVLCGRCGSHLGHIFDDGPEPTGKRYCMNSAVLDFEPKVHS